jgi:hypothetical protein
VFFSPCLKDYFLVPGEAWGINIPNPPSPTDTSSSSTCRRSSLPSRPPRPPRLLIVGIWTSRRSHEVMNGPASRRGTGSLPAVLSSQHRCLHPKSEAFLCSEQVTWNFHCETLHPASEQVMWNNISVNVINFYFIKKNVINFIEAGSLDTPKP